MKTVRELLRNVNPGRLDEWYIERVYSDISFLQNDFQDYRGWEIKETLKEMLSDEWDRLLSAKTLTENAERNGIVCSVLTFDAEEETGVKVKTMVFFPDGERWKSLSELWENPEELLGYEVADNELTQAHLLGVLKDVFLMVFLAESFKKDKTRNSRPVSMSKADKGLADGIRSVIDSFDSLQRDKERDKLIQNLEREKKREGH